MPSRRSTCYQGRLALVDPHSRVNSHTPVLHGQIPVFGAVRKTAPVHGMLAETTLANVPSVNGPHGFGMHFPAPEISYSVPHKGHSPERLHSVLAILGPKLRRGWRTRSGGYRQVLRRRTSCSRITLVRNPKVLRSDLAPGSSNELEQQLRKAEPNGRPIRVVQPEEPPEIGGIDNHHQ